MMNKNVKYECQNMFTHEVIATFDSYEKADTFLDAAYDFSDWEAVPPMTIAEVTDDAD